MVNISDYNELTKHRLDVILRHLQRKHGYLSEN